MLLLFCIKDCFAQQPVLIYVGLIGPKSLPSEQLMAMANQKLHEINPTQRDIYQINVKSLDTSDNCAFGELQSLKASSEAIQMFYNENISAIFGPICVEDLSPVGRLSTTLNTVQFNFWREYNLNMNLNTDVQISTMSATNLGTNLAAVLSLFNWHKIALITCSKCFGIAESYQSLGQIVKQTLIQQNSQIEILADIKLEPEKNGTLMVEYVVKQIMNLKKYARVLIVIMGNSLSSYIPFLKALQELDMDTDEYSPILSIARYRAKLLEQPWQIKQSDGKLSVNNTLIDLFDRTIVVANDFYKNYQVQTFANQLGLDPSSNAFSDEQDVQLIQGIQLYESFWAYALSLWKAWTISEDTSSYSNGTLLRNMMLNQSFQGPFGQITLNSQFKRLAPFRVFIVRMDNGTVDKGLYELANISITNDCTLVNSADGLCVGLVANILETNKLFLEQFPPDVPLCGFNNEQCDRTGTIIVVVSVMVAICLGFIIFLCFRKVKRGETTQMPYYIPEQTISFVDMNGYGGSSSMSIHSLQHHIEKHQHHQQQMQQQHLHQINVSNVNNEIIQTKHIGTIEQSFVIIEAFRLKEKLSFDKRDMQLLFQMKQMVHDNINPFIGVCVERPTELLVIWRHCFRGTLEELLFVGLQDGRRRREVDASVASLTSADHAYGNDEDGMRPQRDILDNNFRSAFVRDIIKGLDFLHSSSIGYHGCLTASRCLIDSHWILKLSGFGMSRLLFKWRHNGSLSTGDGTCVQPLIPNCEVHYLSPEIRSAIRSAVLRNKPEEFEFTNQDGQAHDMYAFGAILYEILYRRRIVDIEDSSEGVGDLEALEDDVGIFSAAAEEKLPIFPEFPGEEGNESTTGAIIEMGTVVGPTTDRVHPDLVALMRKCFGRVDQRPDANMARKITDATLKMPGSLVDNFLKNMEQYTNNLENLVREQTGKLEEEQQKAEQILLELLPKSVVDELRLGRRVEPQFFPSVTIMYSDIVGFTSLCSESSPIEVVTLLNGMFRAFDEAISQHQAYKVETIGDAYMVASGVPDRMECHVREIASIALMQRDFLCHYEIPHRPGQFLHCRWGFNSGSVFTGVVGITAPRYCVFGTTVTLAAKMENSGHPDRIQMTLKSYQLLSDQFPEFLCMPRGGVRIEGIGTLLTYWLDGLDESGSQSDRTDVSTIQILSAPEKRIPRSPPAIVL